MMPKAQEVTKGLEVVGAWADAWVRGARLELVCVLAYIPFWPYDAFVLVHELAVKLFPGPYQWP